MTNCLSSFRISLLWFLMEFKIYCIFFFLKATAMKHQERHEHASHPETDNGKRIHGKRTIMVLRELCILNGVCLLKVCHFYFLFFREDISVTNKVDGKQRWWPHFGAAPGFCRWLCIFSPLCFCCLKILCEDKSREYNIMHCKMSRDRRNGEDALFQHWKTVFLNQIHKYIHKYTDGEMLRYKTVCHGSSDGQYFKYMYLKYVFEIQNTILYFVFKYLWKKSYVFCI